MRKEFENLLLEHGYSMRTPSGRKSTIYSYCRGIDIVATNECLTWEALADQINDILPQYDSGGIKQYIGDESNKTIINALKQFSKFLIEKIQIYII